MTVRTCRCSCHHTGPLASFMPMLPVRSDDPVEAVTACCLCQPNHDAMFIDDDVAHGRRNDPPPEDNQRRYDPNPWSDGADDRD